MSALYISLGFDCDRPRGTFVSTAEGSLLAEKKLESINIVTSQLNELNVSRTFFICGMFLEAMCNKFGDTKMVTAFDSNNRLVEIGDHSYSHRVLKIIPTRPDKLPLETPEIEREFDINTQLFTRIFRKDIGHRGYRAPLGHFEGLKNNPEIYTLLHRIGVSYVSSDLRDENNSLCPELLLPNKKPRQPYLYPNGLLEIPSIGWQDTVFSGTTKTQLFKMPPSGYSSIILYFEDLFTRAKTLTSNFGINYFLPLVLHPYDISIYNTNGSFLYDLVRIAKSNNGEFIKYEDIKMMMGNI